MLLREARGPRSMAEIAAVSGVPAETLRKIETGRIATPAFFTVAALADALGLSLEESPGPAQGPGRGAQRLTHRVRVLTEAKSAVRTMPAGPAWCRIKTYGFSGRSINGTRSASRG